LYGFTYQNTIEVIWSLAGLKIRQVQPQMNNNTVTNYTVSLSI